MTFKTVAMIASLGAIALAFSPGESFARGGRGGPAAVPFVSPGVPIGARPFSPHLHRGFAGGFWPAGGYYYGGVPYGEPLTGSSLPMSTDVNYTYTYKQDVPWDWAHRYPPMVVPSDRPYVPGCSSEPVTVPGRSGDQTVNVIRCY
ncbi:MAG: hypothetical protein U1E61_11555 [Bradyrhizobium sp.]